ncbi:MAG: glycine--tRNA ligase [DPANN group archaeon]|nr:glycine--tRNA ligase [DPANN group archaeon]
MISIDELAAFCKKKGFVFRTSELYNGIAGFFDFGPVGVELKNNIKQAFWKTFVRSRDDVVGMDGAIITHPKVWQASGHTASFADLMLTTQSGEKLRADQFIEEQLNIPADGLDRDKIAALLRKHGLKHPKTKEPLEIAGAFNLMFTTNVGAVKSEDSLAYLRPETAQLIFSDFRQVMDTSRMKLPFGIAQMGKAFRNEISPRDFLFRSREFEQFEIEFFCHPKKLDDCPGYDSIKDIRVQILTAKHQEAGKDHETRTIDQLLKAKVFRTKWHAYWVAVFHRFFTSYGIRPENLRLREHLRDELAHYASACLDIEYRFPFGWKEIHGDADRGTFDLGQHQEASSQDQTVFDDATKEKVLPYVAAEPSQGIERAFLAFLFDAYDDDKDRGNIVLHLHPRLAPIQVAVFPLVNKLEQQAREVFRKLNGPFSAVFDRSGSIGRRYARADELGIPLCVTFDFDSLEDGMVTVRDRETTKQTRVKMAALADELKKQLER